MKSDEAFIYSQLRANLHNAINAYKIAQHGMVEEMNDLELMKEIENDLHAAKRFLKNEASVVSIFECNRIKSDIRRLSQDLNVKKRIIANIRQLMVEKEEEIKETQKKIDKLLVSCIRGKVLPLNRSSFEN